MSLTRSAHRSPARLALAAGTLALVLVPVAGCSSSGDVSIATGPTASAAPASGAHLQAAAFAASMKRPGTTLIDVRTPAEFAAGHLPGAVNIDLQGVDFVGQLQALDPAGSYAVYCHSGNRSAVALQQMAALGFTGAYDLSGGITAWQNAGGEVTTD